MRCIRCHRKLTREPQDGMGPTCFAKSGGRLLPTYERDLLGFEIGPAADAAKARMRVLVNVLTVQARIDLRDAFAAARRRLGVWA